MTNPQLVTAPTTLPLTVEDVRAHFKYLETAEDGLLTLYLRAAVGYAETWLRRSFCERTYCFRLDGFFDRDRRINVFDRSAEILLPMPPIIAVTSIEYDDADGIEKTVDDEDYIVDIYSEPGRIKPAPNASWPATQTGGYGTVRITYRAGYATAAAVPEQLRMVLRWLCALWWRNREPVAPTDLRDVPHTVADFMDTFRILRVG